jgi:2-iminobutanoate/2-iminopropanoate deaminase
MQKSIIRTDRAPAPVGAYNQAVRAGNLIYVSGQIAINPATGELITGDIESETRQVLDNLRAIVEAGGSSMDQVVKCEVFVNDMGNFGRVNTVYAEYFTEESAPARALVEVAALPKYVNVEISCIALTDN